MPSGSRDRVVRWSPSSERDLGRAHEFLRARSPRLAAAVVARIIRVVDLLEQQPELGTVAEDLVPHGTFRHFPSSPYRGIYRLTDDEIWIARIWDTRRDPMDLRVPDDADSPDGDARTAAASDHGASS